MTKPSPVVVRRKSPRRHTVKFEAAILVGLHFLNRGFQAALDLYVRPSDGAAILIDTRPLTVP